MANTIPWQNWGRNQNVTPHQIAKPADEAQVASLIKQAITHDLLVKPMGAGHSFTAIAMTDDVMVDMSALSGIVSVDHINNQVTVGGGTVLHDLNLELWKRGLSLPNLGDIDVQTVTGALATGTHGTGNGYQTIAAGVVAMRLVTGDGSILSLSPESLPELFNAARVGLGALGVITEVTLQCEPAFRLEAVEETLAIDQILETFTEVAATNEHSEFFWFPHTGTGQRKINNRSSKPASSRSKLKTLLDDEITNNLGLGVLCKLGEIRPKVLPSVISRVMKHGDRSQYVAPSHEVFCSPRRVRFVEMEYNIARVNLLEAFDRVRSLLRSWEERGDYISFPIEVRTLGPDNIPLSPAYQRDSGYIAVHMYRGTDYADYFNQVEAIMADYQGRPHWGKMHTQTSQTLAPLYPAWDTFQAARKQLDPHRRFANAYLDRVLG